MPTTRSSSIWFFALCDPVTLTFDLSITKPLPYATCRISQGHYLHQLWTLRDHSFLSYAVDRQTTMNALLCRLSSASVKTTGKLYFHAPDLLRIGKVNSRYLSNRSVQTRGWALDRVHAGRAAPSRWAASQRNETAPHGCLVATFCAFWLCDLDLWRFELVFIDKVSWWTIPVPSLAILV